MQTARSIYRGHFENAIERGKRFGFSVPTVAPTTAKLIFDDPRDEMMLAVVRELAKTYQADDLPGGCLHVSHSMRDAVSAVAGARAAFTVGSVTYLGKTMFDFTEAELASWITDGLPAPARGVHAWLTMPTMEIVDFTYAFTMKAVAPHTISGQPMPIIASPDRVGQATYKPLLVANDFVERVGAIKFFTGSPGAGWMSNPGT